MVRNLILKTFKFLEEQYFYTPIYKEEVDDIFTESLHIDYVNEIKAREIGISYTKGDVGNEIRHTFTASIIRLPYKDVADFFSLHIYLRSKGIDFSTNIINVFDEADAEGILIQIANALKEHTLSIIDGREWLESYYPRKD